MTWSSTVSHVQQEPQHLYIGKVCTCICMYARLHLQRWPGGSTRGWFRIVAYGRCRVVASWGPHKTSIGDLSMFLNSTGPQVSIGVEYVSIRACKRSFLPSFFGASSLAKKVLPDANTKIKTVQPKPYMACDIFCGLASLAVQSTEFCRLIVANF